MTGRTERGGSDGGPSPYRRRRRGNLWKIEVSNCDSVQGCCYLYFCNYLRCHLADCGRAPYNSSQQQRLALGTRQLEPYVNSVLGPVLCDKTRQIPLLKETKEQEIARLIRLETPPSDINPLSRRYMQLNRSLAGVVGHYMYAHVRKNFLILYSPTAKDNNVVQSTLYLN